MRFDDSLETVLAADISSPLGVQSAWRQLVDLIGRRRVPPAAEAIARLRAIRVRVPPPVRAASARALAFATPPAVLVRVFAEDEPAIAAPVLRTAQLAPAEWIAILPAMASANRSILRHRRDLGPAVGRALESYGPSDFVLPSSELTPAPPPAEDQAPFPDAPQAEAETPPLAGNGTQATESTAAAGSAADVLPVLPDDAVLVSLAGIALGIPAAGEVTLPPGDAADADTGNPDDSALSVAPLAAPDERIGDVPAASEVADEATAPRGTFDIADIVARIDAFQRHRDEPDGEVAGDIAPDLPPAPDSFHFETDSRGLVRWVAGVSRAALIGLAIDGSAQAPGAQVDGAAAGAFRRRAAFANARLLVDGMSDAAGQWRISGLPVFDRATGRFMGYRGSGRRPRADERAEPGNDGRTAGTDAVRQLVHELRTPTTAIAGFAEMIEGEMLGPVPTPYRSYAGTIRHQAMGLLGAIDDLDTAARLDSNALDLRHETVPLQPLLARIVDDLRPLATLRRTRMTLFGAPDLKVHGDARAVERLVGRLLATMLAAGGVDEAIMVTTAAEGADTASITVDRPRALAAYAGDALLSIDPDSADEDSGAPLLGTGFALRLVRNLAVELGGSLTIGADRLTLRLPAAVTRDVGQVSTN